MMVITFIIVFLCAIAMNSRISDDNDEATFLIALAIFVAMFELILSYVYLSFKSNPEAFGYTRIEQELETEVIDEESTN